jgi:hypothetical protein
MTDQNPNISQFAKTIGKDPSYLSKLCKKLGVEGSADPRNPRSRLLSIDDQDKLRDYIGMPSRTVPDTIPIEIIADCAIVQDAPVLPDRIGLSLFRGDQAQAMVFDDPGAIADQICGVSDALIGAMEAATIAQRAKLNQTIAAVERIKDKADELREARLKHELRIEFGTTQQNQATSALSAQVGKLQALGVGTG